MDTVARMTLMLISGKQTFVDEKDKRQPAIKWLLDVMSVVVDADLQVGSAAAKHAVFRIQDAELLTRLGLEPRDGFYAYDEFGAKLDELLKDKNLPPKLEQALEVMLFQRDVYGRLSSGVASRYKIFRIDNDQVVAALGMKARSGFRYALEEFLPQIGLFWDYFARLEQERPAGAGASRSPLVRLRSPWRQHHQG